MVSNVAYFSCKWLIYFHEKCYLWYDCIIIYTVSSVEGISSNYRAKCDNCFCRYSDVATTIRRFREKSISYIFSLHVTWRRSRAKTIARKSEGPPSACIPVIWDDRNIITNCDFKSE